MEKVVGRNIVNRVKRICETNAPISIALSFYTNPPTGELHATMLQVSNKGNVICQIFTRTNLTTLKKNKLVRTGLLF